MSLPSRPRLLLTSRARIRLGLGAVGALVAIGTVVFHLLEGWSIADSFYVTAQTVTTVGFGDLSPSTLYGRIFASIFMLLGVGVVLYALTSTVQSIVQSEMVLTFGQFRRSLKMSKLRDHFIICGAGRVGTHLIRALQSSNDPFIVIESDRARVEELTDRGVQVLARDATLDA
jgi:voltage-gated potassium channel